MLIHIPVSLRLGYNGDYQCQVNIKPLKHVEFGNLNVRDDFVCIDCTL